MQQSYPEYLLSSAPTGPNSEKDNRNHDRDVQTNDLKGVVNKLIPGSIRKDIQKGCPSIHPLHDVFVRRVKMLKKPKFELGKLREFHGDSSSLEKTTENEAGAKVEQADEYKSPV